MSKRLQVLLKDNEYKQLSSHCKKARIPISRWVRETIHQGMSRAKPRPAGDRLAKILGYAKHQGPTADIEDVLDQINSSYDRKS